MSSTIKSEALESWSRYDYVDPREWRTDPFGREMLPASRAADREQGRNGPFVETEQELATVRGLARMVTTASCPGAGILNNLTNYVVGTGFKFTAGAKRRRPAPAGLISAVQDAVDEFLDDNDFHGDLDRELFARVRRDGEVFVALYPQAGGRTVVRIVEPEQITAPQSPPVSEAELGLPFATDWSLGIHTPEHDVNTVLGYNLRWQAGDIDDYLPAALVEHWKANVDRNVKRGLSDFFPAWQWLSRHEKLLANTGEGAAVQAAIAFVRQHAAGTTQQQIESVRSARADYTLSHRTAGGERQTYVQRYESGTILDIPRGLTYLAGPLGAERGPHFIDIAQALLRHVATRWAMPEYMISGDASNANYASTVEAGTPFVGCVEALQANCKSRFGRLVWKALANFAAAGRFQRFGTAGSYASLLRLIEISIEPPRVANQNKLQETQRREILHRAGVLSLRTWQTQEGLDPEMEL